ncbi:MAG: hypothetical protein O2955_00175 [Planctomycetota bacterium]|nr:hypothetical protein [Planctomycetota bacterium]MDA1210896.1 hypothetical protein [Planctomycetota bacterium]
MNARLGRFVSSMCSIGVCTVVATLFVVTGENVGQSESSGAASPMPDVFADIDRSPNALAISPGHDRMAVVNHTSDSISIVSIADERLEFEVSLRGDVQNSRTLTPAPWDVLWIDNEHLAVSLMQSDQLAIYKVSDDTLSLEQLIDVGDEPRGLALATSHDDAVEKTIFVCLAEEDAVVAVTWPEGELNDRISVGGHPRTIAVSPDQQWLVTCCSTPGEVFVHDAQTRAFKQKRYVFDRAFNLGRPFIAADSSQVFVTGAINRAFPIHPDNIERGWAIDNRLTRIPLPEGPYWEQKQLGLDPRGNAAGDANAIAVSPDGRWWAVTCGGSHELLLLNDEAMIWPSADPGDFLPPLFQYKPDMLRRIELGGRPCDLVFVNDHTIWIANYLSNSIQIVDVNASLVTKTISLGGPETPSLARRGEAIFYDADRTLNGWFSCHTCHTDGHTNGQTFDTVNDGTLDTFKLVPSLRGVTQTGPWTWHGWQQNLTASIRKSLTDTMNSEIEITDDDLNAVYAFLETLHQPEIHKSMTNADVAASVSRGELIFLGKGGCATCHQGTYYTKPEVMTVGLETTRDYFKGFNPPSLRGLRHRRRFLHDGRAESLEQVLTGGHRPENVSGEALTDAELHDLISFLRTL